MPPTPNDKSCCTKYKNGSRGEVAKTLKIFLEKNNSILNGDG